MTVLTDLTNLPNEFDSFNSLPDNLKFAVVSKLELSDQNALAKTSKAAYNFVNSDSVILDNIKYVLSPLEIIDNKKYNLWLKDLQEPNTHDLKDELKSIILEARQHAEREDSNYQRIFMKSLMFSPPLPPTYVNTILLQKRLCILSNIQKASNNEFPIQFALITQFFAQLTTKLRGQPNQTPTNPLSNDENDSRTLSLTNLKKILGLINKQIENSFVKEFNGPNGSQSDKSWRDEHLDEFTSLDSNNNILYRCYDKLSSLKIFDFYEKEIAEILFEPMINLYSKEALYAHLTSLDSEGQSLFSKLSKFPHVTNVILDKLDENQKFLLLNSKYMQTTFFDWFINDFPQVKVLLSPSINPDLARNQAQSFIIMVEESFETKDPTEITEFFIMNKYNCPLSSTAATYFSKMLDNSLLLDIIVKNVKENPSLIHQYNLLVILFIANEEKFYEMLNEIAQETVENLLLHGCESKEPLINRLIKNSSYRNYRSIKKLFMRFSNISSQQEFVQKALDAYDSTYNKCSIGFVIEELMFLLKYKLPVNVENLKYVMRMGENVDLESYCSRSLEKFSEDELKKLLIDNIKLINETKPGYIKNNNSTANANFVLNFINVKNFTYEEKNEIIKQLPCLQTLSNSYKNIHNASVNKMLLPILMFNQRENNTGEDYLDYRPLLKDKSDLILDMLVNNDKELVKKFLFSDGEKNRKNQKKVYEVIKEIKPSLYNSLLSIEGFDYLPPIESTNKRERENLEELKNEENPKKFRLYS